MVSESKFAHYLIAQFLAEDMFEPARGAALLHLKEHNGRIDPGGGGGGDGGTIPPLSAHNMHKPQNVLMDLICKTFTINLLHSYLPKRGF